VPVIGFWEIAREEPDRLALVGPDGRELSYGELAAETNKLVHGLRARGLTAGDGVAALLHNCVEMYALSLACGQAGWYFTPINHHLAAPEVQYIVEDSEAKVLVDNLDVYADLVKGQPDTLPDDRTAGQPMHYTSGTTGRPKGVRRKLPGVEPELQALFSAGFLGMFGVQQHDGNVHICGSPLYHTAPLAFSSAALQIGHPVVLMDKWTPAEMLDLIGRYRVTSSHMVPTQFHRLLALPDDVKRAADVSSLRSMVHAAAPCPVDIKQRMLDWWGPVIYEYYAATEGGGTLVTPEEWLKKPGTVGRPWPNAEVRILDDDGNDVPANEPATVYMKLPDAAFEYFKDKDKTEASRKAGFFTVGDIGYLDDDGYLFLCDRKSDMIISGGVNIYPAEIEGVFLTHPKVGDVAVFGIPHDDWGEEIKAVVEPAAGIEPGDALTEELLAYCGERMGRFKIPKSIDYTTEMPRDPSGKLYKRKLRDPYWEGRDRAI
jgi:long-chain acyl-CoA synthetase